MKHAYRILHGKSEGKKHRENLVIDENNIKWSLVK
jgi:hypothetical protein